MYRSVLFPLPEGPMIDNASPRASESEMSETIPSGPRGVEYSLETFSTFSTKPPEEKIAADERGFARIRTDKSASKVSGSLEFKLLACPRRSHNLKVDL